MNSAKNASKPAKLTPKMGLKHRNSFGLDCTAELAYEVTSADQLPDLLNEITSKQLPWRVLGGGSNVILPDSLPGASILINIPGQEILASDEDATYLSVGAGVGWHELVAWTLEHDLPGLENLALIPGTVGAAPIQNIGAYGVEIADVMHSLTAIDRLTGARVELAAAACAFAYRDSLFKSRAPGRYIITKVRFLLSRKPTIRLDYGDIRREIERLGIVQVTPRAVANAVIAIRQSKLPDPTKLGNAGSFFKNPVVPVTQADELRQRFPGLVSYPQAVGVKLAAGWLIEQAGWKGRNQGAVGVHDRQALVLIHRGGGSGAQLLQLAADVRASVLDKFGVVLEQEPVIWGL